MPRDIGGIRGVEAEVLIPGRPVRVLIHRISRDHLGRHEPKGRQAHQWPPPFLPTSLGHLWEEASSPCSSASVRTRRAVQRRKAFVAFVEAMSNRTAPSDRQAHAKCVHMVTQPAQSRVRHSAHAPAERYGHLCRCMCMCRAPKFGGPLGFALQYVISDRRGARGLKAQEESTWRKSCIPPYRTTCIPPNGTTGMSPQAPSAPPKPHSFRAKNWG